MTTSDTFEPDNTSVSPAAIPPIAQLPAMVRTRASTKPSRRQFLMGTAAAVTALAASATLNVFPRMKRASASVPPYHEYPYGYDTYGPGSGCPATDAGCVNVISSPDYIDSSFCTTCPEFQANPYNNWNGYYYNGGRNGNQYLFWDRDDNVCRPATGSWDLWVHTAPGCGYCPYELKYRCHDGHKWSSSTGTIPAICHSVHSCNGNLTGQFC